MGHPALTHLQAAIIIVKEARTYVEESLGAKISWENACHRPSPERRREEDSCGSGSERRSSDETAKLTREDEAEGVLSVGPGSDVEVVGSEGEMKSCGSDGSHPGILAVLADTVTNSPGVLEDVSKIVRMASIFGTMPSLSCSDDMAHSRAGEGDCMLVEECGEATLDDLERLGHGSSFDISDVPPSHCTAPHNKEKTISKVAKTFVSDRILRSSPGMGRKVKGCTILHSTPQSSAEAGKEIGLEAVETRCTDLIQKRSLAETPRLTKNKGSTMQFPMVPDSEGKSYDMNDSFILDTQTAKAMDEPLCRPPQVVMPLQAPLQNHRPGTSPTAESEDLFPAIPRAPQKSSSSSEKELFTSLSLETDPNPKIVAILDSEEEDAPLFSDCQEDAPPSEPLLLHLSSYSEGSSGSSDKRTSSPSTLPAARKKQKAAISDVDEDDANDGSVGIALEASVSSLDLSSLCEEVSREFTVKDVTSSRVSLRHFAKNWSERDRFSISLALENCTNVPQHAIGLRRSPRRKTDNAKSPIVFDEKRLLGVAVCWEGYQVHYLALEDTAGEKTSGTAARCMLGSVCESVAGLVQG